MFFVGYRHDTLAMILKGATMEITTTYPKQAVLAKQASSSEQKKNATVESEKNEQAAGDSVQISSKAVKLSQVPASQGSVVPTPIENGEQAQKTAERVVSEFRNNPSLAQQIHGNLVQVNFKLLLE